MGNKIVVAIGTLVVVLSMSVFTVSETERAIKFQLGEIVAYQGLHRKGFKDSRISRSKSGIFDKGSRIRGS